jgi:hypothetical protein
MSEIYKCYYCTSEIKPNIDEQWNEMITLKLPVEGMRKTIYFTDRACLFDWVKSCATKSDFLELEIKL